MTIYQHSWTDIHTWCWAFWFSFLVLEIPSTPSLITYIIPTSSKDELLLVLNLRLERHMDGLYNLAYTQDDGQRSVRTACVWLLMNVMRAWDLIGNDV
jgi:hypothetical protein